jgi:membrane protease YdiL (CAAX protease family)
MITASPFQLSVLAIACVWLAAAARFPKSQPILLGGLIGISAIALGAVAHGDLEPSQLGLSLGVQPLWTVGWALVWLAVMLAYSPVADRIATRFFDKPPTLGAFKAIQESTVKLIAGIVVAWILGGFLEEIVFRGLLLRAVEDVTSGLIAWPFSSVTAIVAAACGAGIIHLYQGPRAALIITQLSVLFGMLFVLSGYDLWSVILCHGLYDTIAFIRFARGTSRYAKDVEE